MILGALVGAVVGAATSVVSQVVSGQPVNWGQVGQQALVGAVTGALSGLAGPEAGLAVHAAVGALAGAAGSIAGNLVAGQPIDWGAAGTQAVIGAVTAGFGEGAGGDLAHAAEGDAAKVAEEDAAGQADRTVADDLGGNGGPTGRPGDSPTNPADNSQIRQRMEAGVQDSLNGGPRNGSIYATSEDALAASQAYVADAGDVFGFSPETGGEYSYEMDANGNAVARRQLRMDLYDTHGDAPHINLQRMVAEGSRSFSQNLPGAFNLHIYTTDWI